MDKLISYMMIEIIFLMFINYEIITYYIIPKKQYQDGIETEYHKIINFYINQSIMV